jgi:hypothetical protein
MLSALEVSPDIPKALSSLQCFLNVPSHHLAIP